MSQRRLGIAVGRRAVSAVGLERAGNGFVLRDRWRVARASGEHADAVLTRLCAEIPEEWRGTDLHLALSPAELACADLLDVPYPSEKQIQRVAGSLAEGRCAGESVEELAIDVAVVGRAGDGARIQLAAMRTARLKELSATVSRLLPHASLERVVPLPFALLPSLPEGDGLWGLPLGDLGEGAVWERKGGEISALRLFPMEGTTEDGLRLLDRNARGLNSECAELRVLDGPVPVRRVSPGGMAPEDLAAAGAVLCDPADCVDLLRGMPEARRSILDPVRAPLLASAVAATVLFLAAGLHFDRCARQHDAVLARCQEREEAVWKATYGKEPYREGALASRLQREVSLARKLEAANAQPSALRLWGELGTAMPNAEQTGMRLEELQLTRRGGRLQAKVPMSEKNPLETALLIESAINRSPAVTAKGAFEQREGQITLRMELDYRPPRGKGRAP